VGLAKTSGRTPDLVPLSLKSLSPGSLLLGIVDKVTPTDVTVALPNNMAGRVALAHVSDPVYAKASGAVDEEAQAAVMHMATQAVAIGQVCAHNQIERCFLCSIGPILYLSLFVERIKHPPSDGCVRRLRAPQHPDACFVACFLVRHRWWLRACLPWTARPRAAGACRSACGAAW
jgi:hypothetical protein